MSSRMVRLDTNRKKGLIMNQEKTVKTLRIMLSGCRTVEVTVTWDHTRRRRHIGAQGADRLDKHDKRRIASIVRQVQRREDLPNYA